MVTENILMHVILKLEQIYSKWYNLYLVTVQLTEIL